MLVLRRNRKEQRAEPDRGTARIMPGIDGNWNRAGIAAPIGPAVARRELRRNQPDVHVIGRDDAAAAPKESRTPTRVLIADADEHLIEGYRDQLLCFGCDAILATSGVECLRKLRECGPNVLVLEPSIPWGGGDGVLAMMHEQSDVPLVPVWS